MRASEKVLPSEILNALLQRMRRAIEDGDSEAIRGLLLEAVEEFRPQCANEDFVIAHK